MTAASVTVQDCGCIALPEDVAAALGMTPGAVLLLAVDQTQRSLTLTASARADAREPKPLTACPVLS